MKGKKHVGFEIKTISNPQTTAMVLNSHGASDGGFSDAMKKGFPLICSRPTSIRTFATSFLAIAGD